MTMSQSQPYSTEALFKGLKGLLRSLPTEEEKRELLRDLKAAQDFLEDLRLLVDAIPTMESSQELSVGLSRLDDLTERAQRDAGLRKLLGLRGPAVVKKKKAVSPEGSDSDGRVSQLEQAITQSETAEITGLLAREPLAVLKELAGRFEVRTTSRERKSDLVNRIATHIENQRGYAILRGGESQPV